MTRTLPSVLTLALALASTSALAGGETKGGSTIWADADGDGVHDLFDLCNGDDDSVDLDNDNTADCSQTFVGTGTFNTSADTQSWQVDATFESTDGNGYAPSGSMDLRNGYSATVYTKSPCEAVSPATAHILLLQASATNPDDEVSVRLYVEETASSDCTGSAQLTSMGSLTGNTSGWDVLGSTFKTRATTHTLRVVVINTDATPTSDTTELLLDNVLLHDNIASGGSSGESKE